MDQTLPEGPAARTTLRGRQGSRPFVMVDGFNLSLDKGTGVATYGRNLSSNLSGIGCEVGVLYGGPFSAHHPALLQEVGFYDSPPLPASRWLRAWRRARPSFSFPWNQAFEVPITGKVIAEQFDSRLPGSDSIWNARNLYIKSLTQFDVLGTFNRVTAPRLPDLCHWTYPLPVYMPGVPNIYTLHDLVPLRLPYTTLDRKDRYLKLLKWICRTAAHIVTVSEHSKRDIVEILDVNPDRITNTYQAVTIPDELRLKPEELVRREIENTFGLTHKEYFLFFGSIEPKKNIGRLIEAYLGSGVQTPLVILGAQAWKSETELRLLKAEHLRNRLQDGVPSPRGILQLEYAPFPLLVSLIRGAKAVLFPSLYEGFGLPVLESMLLGTPVLSSNTSSVPEVAGDAALLINPYATREIAEGIEALDNNVTLRASLAQRGIAQAARFSEAEYQKRLASAYAKVLTPAIRGPDSNQAR